MVSKKYWKKLINNFVDLVKNEKEKKVAVILGVKFEVLPNVFSPIYSSDTSWFAEKIIPLTNGKKFLEIGAGTGVIACLAAIHGAKTVVATDINPDAIKNIILNKKLHHLKIEARIGSVFDPISKDEKFDVIFWNHPFYCLEEDMGEDENILHSVCDTEYQCLKEFLAHGKNHLTKNGQLILGTSNIARINLIKNMSKEFGYLMCLLEKTEVPVYKNKKTKMDLRVYSFQLDENK